MTSRTDSLLEAAWVARVAAAPADVVEFAAVAKQTLGEAFGRREGELHALVHALVKAGRLTPAGRSPSGATRYAAAGAGHASSEPGPDVPPPSSKSASKRALAVASGVRDPEDRGRVVSDVLAHLAAIEAAPGSRSFGSTSRARALLHRVDRGRRTHCTVSTPGEAAKRFAVHEGPGLLGAMIVFVSVWMFVMEPRVVPSRSMQPTLQPGDRIVVWKPSGGEEPPRWSIITFRRDDGVVLVKRVVGLPGESLKIDEDGDVLVNGERLVKPDDVREAVREPLIRSEFDGGRLPEGWVEDGRPIGEKDPVLRLAHPLWADMPRSGDEVSMPGERPVAHDIYVDCRVGSRPVGSRMLWIKWSSPGGGPAADVSGVGLVLMRDGDLSLEANMVSGVQRRLAHTRGPREDEEADFSLSFVDGFLRARVGGWSMSVPLPARRGAARVSMTGLVKRVAIDRDVHYTHPVGARYATENAFAIPAGHVFCLGDHSFNSTDSRFEIPGPVPIPKILGRVRVRIWPPWRVGPIH